MKTLICISMFSFMLISKSYSQLPQDYPFKTLLDEFNNLLVTGYDGNNDLFVSKYPPIGDRLWYKPFINPGNDRGMDIAIDNTNKVIATGYIYNQTTQSNDIFLIKFNGADGNIIWTKAYPKNGDDKAYGIALDNDRNIYVTGYSTKDQSGKNIMTLKYNSDNAIQWVNQYSNKEFNGDDVGTHLVIDDNYLYVSGYTYDGTIFGNDIVMISYSLDSNKSLVQTYQRKGNEIPTSFIISNISRTPIAKSRIALGSITDNPNNPIQKDFITLFFNDDAFSTIKWVRTFNGPGNGNDILTALGTDISGNIFVTGYTYNGSSNQYDYATMKYNKENGNYLWNPPVKYYDSHGGNDKASSIKVGDDGYVYIAGSSDSTLNGYNISAYKQENNTLIQEWSNDFKPTFGLKENSNDQMNKAAKVEVDNLGNIIVIASQWDENRASYAIWKYDHEGNLMYTIDNTGDLSNLISKNKATTNIKRKINKNQLMETGD